MKSRLVLTVQRLMLDVENWLCQLDARFDKKLIEPFNFHDIVIRELVECEAMLTFMSHETTLFLQIINHCEPEVPLY